MTRDKLRRRCSRTVVSRTAGLKGNAMRDRRFIAAHRGGSLKPADHKLLASWAADCAEHLLPLFERSSSDGRPRQAIEVGRAWARGEVRTGMAQRAAVAAHAAARQADHDAAVAVARAAGHAVATAHAADHCLGVMIYGAKAITAAGGSIDEELAWQLARLPSRLRLLVTSAMNNPRFQATTSGTIFMREKAVAGRRRSRGQDNR